MARATEKILFCLYLTFTTLKTVDSINCYQCSGTDSDNPFECNEFLEDDVDLVPIDCMSIHDAQYCIKHVGRYEDRLFKHKALVYGLTNNSGWIWCWSLQAGGISTKRYCSSLDLGNYCNYVAQPGDKLEYRTCIYTCSSDGCNAASDLRISVTFLLFGIFICRYIAFY